MKFSQHEEVAKQYNIGGGGGGKFWNPKQGENTIRVLSEFEPFASHWIESERKSHTCIGLDEGCQYCEAGKKPSVKFLGWVLDRADGEVKIGQVGYMVFKQLGELSTNKDWGFESIPDYDIQIKRTGEELKTEYFVTPTPNKAPLTTEEQEKVKTDVKDIGVIIGKMKEKEGGSPDVIQVEDEEPPKDEIDVNNIPF